MITSRSRFPRQVIGKLYSDTRYTNSFNSFTITGLPPLIAVTDTTVLYVPLILVTIGFVIFYIVNRDPSYTPLENPGGRILSMISITVLNYTMLIIGTITLITHHENINIYQMLFFIGIYLFTLFYNIEQTITHYRILSLLYHSSKAMDEITEKTETFRK